MKTLYALLAIVLIAFVAAADEPLKKSDFDLLKVKVEEHDKLLKALLATPKPAVSKVPPNESTKASLAAACAVWHTNVRPLQMPDGSWAMARTGGSGTVVACEQGKSLIVTNKHVVEDGDGSFSISNGGKSYTGRLLTVDSKADLAVIVVDAELPVAPLAIEEPAAGTKVIQWGCDSRGRLVMVEKYGEVVGAKPRIDNMGDLLTTIDAYEGDSGSGVFNFEGRVVGITWGKRTDGVTGGFCVRLGDVVRFLRGSVRETFPRFAITLDEVRGGPPAEPFQAPKAATAALKWYGYAEGQAVAKATGKDVFLLFTSPENCIYCQKLEAGALKDPALLRELEKFVCIKVDVTKDLETMANFGRAGAPVVSYPSIEVYKGGERVQVWRGTNWEGRLIGNVAAGEILKQLGGSPRPVTPPQHSGITPFLNCGPTG